MMNQTDEILNYLRAGYSLTPLEALDKFGCFRLGARIWEIKDQGYDIESKIVSGPNGKHYSRYTLKHQEKQLTFV